MRSPITVDISRLGPLNPIFEELALKADRENVCARLHSRDDTLWGAAGQPEVANRMGWLDAPANADPVVAEFLELGSALLNEKFDVVVLIGMGGSSLAPEVIWSSAPSADRPMRLEMLDSSDPDQIQNVQNKIATQKPFFLVSTKSGGTLETVSLMHHFWELYPDPMQWAAITDPGSSLEAEALTFGFRKLIFGQPDVGGRYSAMTAFGLVPAALIGAPIRQMVDSAKAAISESKLGTSDSASIRLGLAVAAAALNGRDKLQILCTEPSLKDFALWLEQLLAESTGKEGTGVLPVSAASSADLKSGSDLQVVVFGPATEDNVSTKLQQIEGEGTPITVVELNDTERLGSAFVCCEIAIAICGWALQINPFDQPDVQAAKDATQAVLKDLGSGEQLPNPSELDLAAIRNLVSDLKAPGYLAVLAYLPISTESEQLLHQLGQTLNQLTPSAVTVAFGPRYLHSTGQIHKGGPAGGRFLILEHEPSAQVNIPGQDYDFGTLMKAQALGDNKTLKQRGRTVEHFSLGSGWQQSIKQIINDLSHE